MRILAPAIVVLGGLGALSCGAASSAGGGDECTQVPVFNSTFANYQAWTSFSFDGPAIAGSPHTSGPRRVYVSPKPGHGQTAFATGTIVVKEIGAPPASQDSVFAMVKVGCDYNAGGAANWEWFELQVDAQSVATILWGGPTPPPGMTYSGNPTACNDCHSDAKQNDYVESSALLLSKF
jgi:hypothetical protein